MIFLQATTISGMRSLVFAMVLSTTILAQQAAVKFEVRAKSNLLFGKGETSSSDYYDVVITRTPADGVLIKLPYTRKGGRFSFDLHHRVALTKDFGTAADFTTVIEVLTGGTNSMGTFTIVDKVVAEATFEEGIRRVSSAEIDRYVTPLSRKSITVETKPGPQSISIVGRELGITRGTTTTRIDTPGTRIATVSNFKFEEVTETNPLKKSSGRQ